MSRWLEDMALVLIIGGWGIFMVMNWDKAKW